MTQSTLGLKPRNTASINIIFFSRNGMVGGGVETYVYNTVRELEQKHSRKNISVVTSAQLNDNKLNELYYIKKETNEYNIVEIRETINYIVNKLPCVIVTSQPDNYMIGALVARQIFPSEIKILSIVHGDHKHIYDKYVQFNSPSDYYLGVSKEICNKLRELFKDKKVTHSTGPFCYPKRLERSYSIANDSPIHIGYAGRLDGYHSQKRMDLLLKFIMSLLYADSNFVMEIAGDGPVKSDMERQISKIDNKHKVSFLGMLSQNELINFWKRQDIAVLLSNFEGRSLSNLEAMGCGVVPIRTRTADAIEDIEEGVNGFIVPIGDVQSAVERMQYIENNRYRLPIMGKEARRHVIQDCNINNHIKILENIFDELCDEMEL